MFYEEILSNFYDRLNEIKQRTTKPIESADQCIVVCSQTLNTFKKAVQKGGFKNKGHEIHFFKSLKVVPMQYLIYYTEVRSFELRIPKIGKSIQIQFLDKRIDKVNSFFAKHTEFLIYLDQEYEHFDKHYFTLKHLHRSPTVKSYPYYKDPTFNTSHDGLLARIRGMALFINYLKEKKVKLEKKDNSRELSEKQTYLKWTGSYAAFIEMIYGCRAMDYFNNSNMASSTVIKEMGEFLNIPKGNYSRTYNEIKSRKNSPIKFYEETGQKLLEKMYKEDTHG